MATANLTALALLPQSYLEESIGHPIVVVSSVFLVLQTLAVVLYYTSRWLRKSLNSIECYFLMPVAFLFTTGVCINAILLVKLGKVGRHIEAVILEDPSGQTLVHRSKLEKSIEIIDIAAITGSKLVILCLYMHIFSINRRYRIATYFIGVIILLSWLACLITSFAICTPFAYYWNHKPGGHCGDVIAVWAYSGVANIATDLMMLVVPLPALYRLHVDWYTKAGLFVTFLTGSVGIVTSILRFASYFTYDHSSKDTAYGLVPSLLYTVTESGTYLLASCMPAIPALKRRFFGHKIFARFMKTLIARKSKGTGGAGSGGQKSGDKDIILESVHSEGVYDPQNHEHSGSRLKNAGFLKLDDQATHGYPVQRSPESV